ncbi:uncharacterized protein N7511_006276 [Penicillium nucicola]|uniref:uncharacterized protein n=1 Tax=Penicillium nucicola TaxID=1850975 RepID=UPI002544DB69|nr:uncharacterized protein N7511_006276 [Penicillium nucicola]KAJ5757582.1 hypothetical protein N7511_006276 [Penicillium nucicola]
MSMDYSGFPLFPAIPASIRRRLPRLYSSHRAPIGAESSGDPRRGLASLSEPHLLCHSQSTDRMVPEVRPSSAGDDMGSPESHSPPAEEMGSPTKYEAESGLRWNRVVPGYEAQQPQADGRLARSLYVNALVYLLDALPQDLSADETSMLEHHIPELVKASLTPYPQPPQYLPDGKSKYNAHPRSYLHRLLASTIVQIFILLRLLLPYARLLLRQIYAYERTHRITERILTTTLDTADGLGKSSINIGMAVCKLSEGRVGAALSSFAAWWMEGVAGGIYEGVGEGMMQLGLLGKESDISTSPTSPVQWRPPDYPVFRRYESSSFIWNCPYASAILRFQLRFPDTYPDLPPLVTFATDFFHPLIVPLTTYTFSTGSASDNPVSATDEERLPPGGFSLRHGFPHWFGRAKRSGLASGTTSRTVSGNSPVAAQASETRTADPTESDEASDAATSTDPETSDGALETPRVAQVPSMDQFAEPKSVVPVSEILDYIRSTFDDENVLDSLPVEVAGNPGAWHAWKAHRRGGAGGAWKRASPQARLPGDWHWDGIWARRAHDEIENSRSDPMLFGSAARGNADDMIRFSRLDKVSLDAVKESMAAMVGNV